MPDENPIPEPDPIEIDLESVIGNILDKRGVTSERLSKMDSLDIKGLEDSLTTKLTEMFAANKPAQAKEFDSEGFSKNLTGIVSNLLDDRLKGIQGVKRPSKPGPLSRFLGTAT